MRTLFFLLLLANLTLFGYITLDNMNGGEGVRLHQQLQPEKIRVLTPQQVAALGPEKTASLADVCAEWGPFTDTERVRALADLEPLGLGRLITSKKLEASSARVTARQGPGSLTSLVIRDPPSNAIGRLKELQAAYPSAEVRIGTCDKTP